MSTLEGGRRRRRTRPVSPMLPEDAYDLGEGNALVLENLAGTRKRVAKRAAKRKAKRKTKRKPAKRKPKRKAGKRKAKRRVAKRKPKRKAGKRKAKRRVAKRKPKRKAGKRKAKRRVAKRKPAKRSAKRRVTKRKPAKRKAKRRVTRGGSKLGPARRVAKKQPAKLGPAKRVAKRKPAKLGPAQRVPVNHTGGAKKKGSSKGGINAPMTPVGPLAAIVGKAPLPRHQALKKLWAHFKKHNLNEGREIFAKNDANVKEIFGGKKKITMFQVMTHMNKFLK